MAQQRGKQGVSGGSAGPRKPREFAEGTRRYPGSYRGLAGEPSGGGRMLAPFGVRYADPVDGRYLKGGEVKSFYCHHYRQPNEHYHASLEDQHKCPA